MNSAVRKGSIMKGYKETLKDYGYVHSLNCGDSFIGVCIRQITLVPYT